MQKNKIVSEKDWKINLFIQTSYNCFPILQGQEGVGGNPGPRGLKVIYFLLIRLHLIKQHSIASLYVPLTISVK